MNIIKYCCIFRLYVFSPDMSHCDFFWIDLSFLCSAKERELLEELASLSTTTSNRLRTRVKTPQPRKQWRSSPN